MPALRHIALASCPVAVLAACTSSPPQAGRVADARPVPAASAASALAQAACRAAYLPAGTAVYEVRGYSPRCRLAGYVNGQLRVYLAQRDLHGHSAPVSCALPMPAR